MPVVRSALGPDAPAAGRRAWINRRLLLRAGNTLSVAALARLKATLRADDPTDEIGAAWASRNSCGGC